MSREGRWWAMGISLLLSWWAVSIDNIINKDGIHYLEAARLLTLGETSAAAQAYSWLFYPALIAAVQKMTGMAGETSAHVLNALFFALFVFSFMKLSEELSGKEHQWAAALVVLTHPGLNGMRAAVLRDSGYIAFFTLSILFFLHFFRRPGWRLALAWELSLFMAALFRVEGVIFVVLIPLLILFNREISIRRRILYSLFARPLSLFILGGAMLFHRQLGAQGDLLVARLVEVKTRFSEVGIYLTTVTQYRAQMLVQNVIGEYSDEYAVSGVVLLMFVILIHKVASKIGFLHLVLAAWSLRERRFQPLSGGWAVLGGHFVLHVLLLFGFVFYFFFLSGRFALPELVLVSLMIPPLLTALLAQYRAGMRRKIILGLSVIFILLSVKGVAVFTRSGYLREAGAWLAGHMRAGETLLTNDQTIAHYAGHYRKEADIPVADTALLDTVVAHPQAETVSALALLVKDSRDVPLVMLGFSDWWGVPPSRVIEGHKGRVVLIYTDRPGSGDLGGPENLAEGPVP